MDSKHQSATEQRSSSTVSDAALLGSAAFLCLVVLISVMVDGTFTNDEGHYTLTILGLRDGTFRWEATRGLMDSAELLLPSMQLSETPITPQQPPLYAFLALPLSYLGWPWLIGLNSVAFVATGVMVHRLAARGSTRRATPWMAMAIYWLACFSLEYALGMWPHCVAVALVIGGLWCMLLARDGLARQRRVKSLALAAAAGLLFGMGCGVRYQELVFAVLAAAGASLTLPWLNERVEGSSGQSERPRSRLRAGTGRAAGIMIFGLALGLAGPLATMSLINHARLGSYNPISKGRGYTQVQRPWAATNTPDEQASELPVAVSGFLFRVVDYSQKPAGTKRGATRATGDPLVYAGVAKKALLQSAPWMVLPLGMFLVAWLPRRKRDREEEPADERAARTSVMRRRDLRTHALVALGVIGLFSIVGAARTSGFCFNMRYFLELMPLGAVVIAWALERMKWRNSEMAIALAVGGGLALLGAWQSWQGKHMAMLSIPLLLAALIALGGLLRHRARRWTPVAIALGLGWATAAHLAEDTRAALTLRADHGFYRDLVARLLTDQPTAVFAFRGNTTPFYPLQLDHSLVLVDPFMDGGKTAAVLMDQLLERGSRVLVLPERMPGLITKQLLDGRMVRRLPEERLVILEVQPSKR